MFRPRLFIALVTLLAMLVIAAGSGAQGALTVTPPSGPNGTTHTVSAVGLQPNAPYTLDVLYQPTNALVFTTDFQSDGDGNYSIDLTSEPADPAGVYVINITENGAVVQTSSLTITAPTGAAGAQLAAGTQDGQLDESRISDDYTLTGTAGQIISLTLRSGAFDAFLVLYDPAGLQLRYSDNALPPTTDAQIAAFELPADGNYRVSVTSRSAAETNGSQRASGAYSLTLSIARPANEGAIAYGELVVGELGIVQQSAQYSFEGRAGEVVTIDVRSDAFDPAVALVSGNGDRLALDDDGGGGLNARINRFTLPTDGTYLIVADGFRGFTGDRTLQGRFTVALTVEGEASAPVAQATSTPAPDTAQVTPLPALPSGSTGTLDFGQSAIGELTAEAQLGRYTFVGTAGDVITIQTDSDEFDPKIRLLDSDGTLIAEDDDSGSGLNALLENVTLPRDGEYVIEVDGFRGPSGDRQLFGQFSLTLNRTETAAQAVPTIVPTTAPETAQPTAVPTVAPSTGQLASGVPLNGELTEQAQTASYTFNGAQGDTITLDLTSDDFDPLVRVLSPDGAVLAEDDDSGGGIQARISEVVLPATGTYTVEVDSFRGVDPNRLVLGAYTLTLTLTAAPVEPTATPTLPPTATPVPTNTPEAAAPTAEPTTPAAEVTPDPTAIPLPTATPVTAEPAGSTAPDSLADLRLLGYGDTATVVFDGVPGASESFRMTGRAGDLVSITVKSAGDVDTAVRLFDSTGALIAEDDDSGAGFDPELFGVALPADGDYSIVLYTLSPAAQSSVEIT
nr:PPC domain-containing protein [Anaerolineae bacterium]